VVVFFRGFLRDPEFYTSSNYKLEMP
jgi:hypothetical protein